MKTLHKLMVVVLRIQALFLLISRVILVLPGFIVALTHTNQTDTVVVGLALVLNSLVVYSLWTWAEALASRVVVEPPAAQKGEQAVVWQVVFSAVGLVLIVNTLPQLISGALSLFYYQPSLGYSASLPMLAMTQIAVGFILLFQGKRLAMYFEQRAHRQEGIL